MPYYRSRYSYIILFPQMTSNDNINAQRQSVAAKRDDHAAVDIEQYLPPKDADIQREGRPPATPQPQPVTQT